MAAEPDTAGGAGSSASANRTAKSTGPTSGVSRIWEAGWRTVFDTLESLKPEEIDRTVTIRGEPHTVVEAVNRQLSHYGQHTGQIVFLAKHLKSSDWKTLSIALGGSAAAQ